jgi:hypothetical protein
MSPHTVIEIPVFLDVQDVMASMKCARTTAYAHMRKALGRLPGARGHLRVPVYVWQRYVRMQFDPEAAAARPRFGQRDKRDESATGPIPITRPRTKPRPGSRGTD